MNNRTVMGIFIALGLLSGCASTNNAMVDRSTHVEFYRIFDIKGVAQNRDEMAHIFSDGIGRWVSSLNESNPIPTYTDIPEKPGRFKIIERQFTGNAAAFMAMAGMSGIKSVECPDAIWIGKANRPHSATTNGINFTACLFQYQGGYSFNVYAEYTEKSGFTLNPVELGARLGAKMAGSPSEFIEKTVAETLIYVHESLPDANITYVDGYPKYSGLPWMNAGQIDQK